MKKINHICHNSFSQCLFCAYAGKQASRGTALYYHTYQEKTLNQPAHLHVTHVEREFRKSRHADIVFARVHTQDKKNVRSGGWMFVAIPLEDFNDFVDKLGNVIDDSKGHEGIKTRRISGTYRTLPGRSRNYFDYKDLCHERLTELASQKISK